MIDYKTGDDSLRLSDAELAERHGAQLAGYRALLVELYPAVPLHAALLLANGRLIEVGGP